MIQITYKFSSAASKNCVYHLSYPLTLLWPTWTLTMDSKLTDDSTIQRMMPTRENMVRCLYASFSCFMYCLILSFLAASNAIACELCSLCFVLFFYCKPVSCMTYLSQYSTDGKIKESNLAAEASRDALPAVTR